VNEKGAEASAVTIPVMQCCSLSGIPPETSIADHPFLYVIADSTGQVLFTGCYTGM
jgi:serine protease inhibitor